MSLKGDWGNGRHGDLGNEEEGEPCRAPHGITGDSAESMERHVESLTVI